MPFTWTKKRIEEMCGAVSFKRGESYVQAGQVTVHELAENICRADVKGKETFSVTVSRGGGEEKMACTCPSLPSFPYKCQHIAAVLLHLHGQEEESAEPADGLLTLAAGRRRPYGRQVHFEDREAALFTFHVKPSLLSARQLTVGICVGGVKVERPVRFLQELNEKGIAYGETGGVLFDADLHYVEPAMALIIDELIRLSEGVEDEPAALPLPAAAYEKLEPLFTESPAVYYLASEFFLKAMVPPVHFDVKKAENGHSIVRISGLSDVTVFPAYGIAAHGNQLFRLQEEDGRRLLDLQRMTAETKGTELPVAEKDTGFFIEKVVPGLRRIGSVTVDDAAQHDVIRSPLLAKLYLDRVGNRLLASLEFQYGPVVLNPFEDGVPAGSDLLRDEETEQFILQVMRDSGFAEMDMGYVLHNEELEYEFLYRQLPILEKSVRVYATTAVRLRIVKKNSRPRIRIKAFEERTNWLEFTFSLDGIADSDIKGVLSALEEKQKYYRLKSGALLSLETGEFEEMRRIVGELPGSFEDLEKGLNLPVAKGLRFIPQDGDDFITAEESARGLLNRLLHPDPCETEVPDTLKDVLHAYQKIGFAWMKRVAEIGAGGILADEMGLGKTVQSIAFIISSIKEIRKAGQPVLIVCPSSLLYNWLSELKKFAPELSAAVLDGDRKKRAEKMAPAAGKDVWITSYPILRQDIDRYAKQRFHTIFFDEAQAFKNPFTQTARAVKRLNAQHRFALTGTPMENALEELWSVFHVVFPSLFGGLREFSELRRAEVAKRIRPFVLRRLKEDVLQELPAKIETAEPSELLPEQKELYAAYLAKLRHDTLKHLNKETVRKNRIRILAGLTRLRQICCHPALFVEGYQGTSAKYEQLKNLLKEAERAGRRVLVFSQFTSMLSIIGSDLVKEGRAFFYLDGDTEAEERLHLCRRFNEGERDLFLISLKAGGTGLNLTGADTVILYDLWWNPAVEQQAAGRAHRIGQKHAVRILKLYAKGTVEEKIMELQEQKQALIGDVLSTSGGADRRLTDEDILHLLDGRTGNGAEDDE